MAEYLLPCACGQHTPVSTSQAGQSVRCACGATLEVPTLRGLAQLERSGAVAAPRARRAWSNRHRVVFVLALLTLAASSVAGYLAVAMPAEPLPMLPEIDEHSQLSDVMAVAEHLKTGLNVPPPQHPPFELALLERRRRMIWGVKIALTAAACGLVAGAVVLLSDRRQKR